ncbi:MAG TPA: hypothetical protein VNJ07_13445, partial [Chitinophagales bacterium]|nr:hypothetical protein [Chitinophagales bacterium]
MLVKEVTTAAKPLTDLNPRDYILIRGARTHNLKNIDVAIPRNRLVVITGVSGSGKSSLTIDTLYAEGQRRYVESLSAYARQFLMRMNKPDVDYIKGICPALAIEQKVSTRSTRSTVGSLTEIYDYLRLLYARIGKTVSPVSGGEVKKHDVSDVLNYILSLNDDTRVLILVALQQRREVPLKKELELLIQKGFTRIHSNGVTYKIEECLDDKNTLKELSSTGQLEILIDRVAVKHHDEELNHRISDSVSTAFFEGHGECVIETADNSRRRRAFNNRFELDGLKFEEPTPHFFNFNNPYGACRTCEGFGSVIGIDEDLVVPDKNLSVYEGAIACWRGEKMSEWRDQLVMNALKFDFPIHRSYKHLTRQEKQLLWNGNEYFKGINDFFQYLESKSYKIQYRVMLSRYRGRTRCPDCEGSRLRKDAAYVKINGKSISELLMMQVSDVHAFFKNIQLTAHEQKIAKRLLVEITNRLALMEDVGLSYLTLNRLSGTLSGGETQRINLTSSLGSNLTDSLYILDEPSVGLHPRDTHRLLKVLKALRDLGNTVVVVEHEEEIIREADYLIDLGPLAGTNGGEVVYQGTLNDVARSSKSLTGAYMSGKMKIDVPPRRRKSSLFIEVVGASQHNLKDIHVKFPLNTLTAVSGVSGSGKTTLVKQILYPALHLEYGGYGIKPGAFRELKGDIRAIRH